MALLVRDSPDVLISDIGMPGEDGYTMIRRIRALRLAVSAVPAIALTAYARVDDRVKAIQPAGVAACDLDKFPVN